MVSGAAWAPVAVTIIATTATTAASSAGTPRLQWERTLRDTAVWVRGRAMITQLLGSTDAALGELSPEYHSPTGPR